MGMGYGTRRWPSDPGCLMTINPEVMDSSSPATKRAGDIGNVDQPPPTRALPCKSKSFPSLPFP